MPGRDGSVPVQMRRNRLGPAATWLLVLLATALALSSAQVVCVGNDGHVALEVLLDRCGTDPGAPGSAPGALDGTHRTDCHDFVRGQVEPPTRPEGPAAEVAALSLDTPPPTVTSAGSSASTATVTLLAGRNTVLRL